MSIFKSLLMLGVREKPFLALRHLAYFNADLHTDHESVIGFDLRLTEMKILIFKVEGSRPFEKISFEELWNFKYID